MRQFTESERVAMEKAWDKNFKDEPALSFYDSLEAGFAAALNHSDKQIAALTTERDGLQEQLLAALTESVIAKDQLSQALSNGLNPYLKTERDSLREQLFKATKDLKRMARDWRAHAAGDYCQTYNTGMADGLTRTADQLEDYVNDEWRALDQLKSKPTTTGEQG